MTAPSTTDRVTPTGLLLRDGYQTLITFALDPDCNIWEISVSPPGVDGGEMIDNTTMHNTTRRTKTPRSLIEDTDGSMRVAYDPLFYTQLLSLINKNGEITVTFPDGSQIAYWGCMRTFQPQEHSEGEMPEAEVTFSITNLDTAFAEEGPTVEEASGT